MSWTDKELAEMANASQAEQKFAYNDSYFAEVEAMLPKKKKKLFPFFVLPLIPMLGILGYLGMYEPTSTHVVDGAKTMQVDRRQVAQAYSPIESTFQSTAETKMETNTTNSVRADLVSSNPISRPSSNRSMPLRSVLNERVILDPSENVQMELTAVEMPKIGTLNLSTIEFLDVNNLTLNAQAKPIVTERNNSILDFEVDRLQSLPLHLFSFQSPSAPEQMAPFTPRKTWSMYVEAGVGMGESYLTSQVGHTQMASLGAGARYDFRSTFVQFGLAGEFQKVSMEISDRAKIYHTSSTELENVMDYKQLYRLQMPFTFGYKLNKHSLQASLTPSYLMGAKMKYTYLENGLAMRNETMYNQRKGWNDFSTSVGFGYGYQLFKGLTLGANVNWQYMNQINRNEVSEGNQRPFSGQVFVRKTFK